MSSRVALEVGYAPKVQVLTWVAYFLSDGCVQVVPAR